jgi:hypothetical protein
MIKLNEIIDDFLKTLNNLKKFEVEKYPTREYLESNTWIEIYNELFSMNKKDKNIHNIISWVYLGAKFPYNDYKEPVVKKVDETIKKLINKKLKLYWNVNFDTTELEQYVLDLKRRYKKITIGKIPEILEYLTDLITFLHENWMMYLPEQTAESTIKGNIKSDYIYNIKRLLKEEPMFILSDKQKWNKFMDILKQTLEKK